MRTGEHLLIVSHTFPPYRGIGGRRWAKFAKELARRGYIVHVVHSAGGDDLKGSLWTDDIAHPGIRPHPLPQRYPSVLFKRPLTSFREKVMYRVWRRLLPLVTRGNWLDKGVRWRGMLVRKASALIEAHGIRNVVVTGAPFSLMAHLTELRTRHLAVNLVADFRDPWTWGDYYGQGLLGEARIAVERAHEAAVARTYDRLLSPAPSIVEHLRATYGGPPERYLRIPHAIDPEEIGTHPAPPADGRFRMIYAGSLYGAQEAEAYFEEVLKAFEALRRDRPDRFPHVQLDLFITGHDTSAYAARVAERGLVEHIRFHAPLPAKDIFPHIAAADLVLIFIPTANKDFLGTKFTEIFHLRRPVLHVGVPGFVSTTITGKRLGGSIRVEEVARELPRILSGERTITLDPTVDLSEHLLATITDRLLAEVLR
ncbi:MAG: glycosyltransferase [Bacteroidetes bacterium]|nr:glycosyltransferase [Bacteroidota bacterium]